MRQVQFRTFYDWKIEWLEFAPVILLRRVWVCRGGNPVTPCQFTSEVKFLNESYCRALTARTSDGSDRCGTRSGEGDDTNGTFMCTRKRRTRHLFKTGLPPGEEETSRRTPGVAHCVRPSEIGWKRCFIGHKFQPRTARNWTKHPEIRVI